MVTVVYDFRRLIEEATALDRSLVMSETTTATVRSSYHHTTSTTSTEVDGGISTKFRSASDSTVTTNGYNENDDLGNCLKTGNLQDRYNKIPDTTLTFLKNVNIFGKSLC